MHAPSGHIYSFLKHTQKLLIKNNSFPFNKYSAKCFVKLWQIQKQHLGSSHRKNSIFKEQEQEIETYYPSYGQPLESWHYNVQQFGKLRIRSPMSIHVQPLNPHIHPEMNKVFFNILYTGKKTLSVAELASLTKQYIVTVQLDANNEEMDVTIQHKDIDASIPAVCHFQIPVKYDLDATCSHKGDATLEDLESTNININTRSGSCTCKSIKAADVHISCEGGNIISQSLLQGNLRLRCGSSGDIEAGRLQGQTISCQTVAGNICVKSVYAATSTFTSTTGNLRFGSCHGNTNVAIEKGNLTVDAMDGDLTTCLDEGTTSVYVAREGHLDLNSSQGDILLKVPKSLCTAVSLHGSSVELGEVNVSNCVREAKGDIVDVTGDLGPSKSVSGVLGARTSGGNISMQYQDWLSMLTLKT